MPVFFISYPYVEQVANLLLRVVIPLYTLQPACFFLVFFSIAITIKHLLRFSNSVPSPNLHKIKNILEYPLNQPKISLRNFRKQPLSRLREFKPIMEPSSTKDSGII